MPAGSSAPVPCSTRSPSACSTWGPSEPARRPTPRPETRVVARAAGARSRVGTVSVLAKSQRPPLRLTRRARRLAVVMAVAAGVALGSWVGPLIAGDGGEFYWTQDHYESFERIARRQR